MSVTRMQKAKTTAIALVPAAHRPEAKKLAHQMRAVVALIAISAANRKVVFKVQWITLALIRTTTRIARRLISTMQTQSDATDLIPTPRPVRNARPAALAPMVSVLTMSARLARIMHAQAAIALATHARIIRARTMAPTIVPSVPVIVLLENVLLENVLPVIAQEIAIVVDAAVAARAHLVRRAHRMLKAIAQAAMRHENDHGGDQAVQAR
jgi:hypothetical protein